VWRGPVVDDRLRLRTAGKEIVRHGRFWTASCQSRIPENARLKAMRSVLDDRELGISSRRKWPTTGTRDFDVGHMARAYERMFRELSQESCVQL